MESDDCDARNDPPPGVVPGLKDSAFLSFDAALTLVQLVKAELRQWLATLPELVLLDLYRLPTLLLTWISFGVFVACTVFAMSGDLVSAAASFFILQLGLTLLLEHRRRRLHARMQFRETRSGFVALQASLRERFEREGC